MTFPRGARDRIVDCVLFAFAVAWGFLLSLIRIGEGSMPDPAWVFTLDQAAGALGCLALWLRRRYPVPLAVALLALGTFSETGSGALLVALFSVAVHRPPRTSAAMFGLSLVSSAVYVWLLRPEPEGSPLGYWVFGTAVQGAAIAWGLSVHLRRRLVESLRDRAERAETEARLRAEQAQHHARDAIAREIHDVLGHRLSLLSVHAGALEIRPDAPGADVARAAGVIRESAHQALQDLREVVGVLRAPVGELPQPTFADLATLVGESERAGMRLRVHDTITDLVPDRVGRTLYRIVQEALTNARRHAPGAAVDIRLAGGPGGAVTIEVTNTGPTHPRSAPGNGLLGLGERIALSKGRLDHGPTADGGWRLTARLPWTA